METLRLIGFALQQHCKHDQNYNLAWWERWILTAKCIVSLLLGLLVPRLTNIGYPANGEQVTVAYYDWHETNAGEWGRGADGMVLVVRRYGMGAESHSDGWP